LLHQAEETLSVSASELIETKAKLATAEHIAHFYVKREGKSKAELHPQFGPTQLRELHSIILERVHAEHEEWETRRQPPLL
jgi:hypothetical protein